MHGAKVKKQVYVNYLIGFILCGFMEVSVTNIWVKQKPKLFWEF